MSEDMDTKTIWLIAACCAVVVLFGMSSCTFLVRIGTQEYNDNMQKCIAAGGTFVPTPGGSNNAACVIMQGARP